MAQKSSNSRIINAKLPNEFLKKYFGTRALALKVRSYLLIVLIFQAFMLLILLGFISLILNAKEVEVAELGKAYNHWSRVSQKFPDRPDVLFNMAKSSYENGRKDEAIIYLNKALEIDPLFTKAQEFLEEIK